MWREDAMKLQLGAVLTVPGGLARPRCGRVVFLLALALSLGCVTRSRAATTWTVCASGCHYTSIKAAIAAPTTGDGDTLAIAAGTYTEPGIVVNKRLTLQGEEAATTIVQAAATRGTAPDRVFTIASGVTATLTDLTIRCGRVFGRNYPAYLGGGLYNGGPLTLSHCIIRGNTAASAGGLYNDYTGTLTLSHSTVRDNTAGSYGGGLYGGPLTLTHSTISGNTAGYGGGLSTWGPLTLTNSTVSGNTAFRGGGLYNTWGRLALTHSTISGNTATGSGGGLYGEGAELTLTDSLVAQNPDGRDCALRDGAITSQGYNLDSDGSCQLSDPTDRPGTDPQLWPLQANGGPTFTQALLPGSPAIDAIPWGTHGCGTTVISDQRGQARPQPAGGACDSGAYEVAVAGQALGAWGTGFTPHSVTCQNVTTGLENISTLLSTDY
jgi:predicted outer membrane repeat protein